MKRTGYALKIWNICTIILVTSAMILTLFAPAMAAETRSFSDVASGKWYTQAVAFCAGKGYVSGYEDGTFRPNNKLTRAEMAVIMNKMLGLKDGGRNTFADVPSGKWYTNPILHCVKADVMTGYSDTKFGTSDTLTREQGAVILAKAFGVEKISGRTSFSDDSSISGWAVESVKAMAAKGLISGMGENLFAPKTPLTRAQMCQIIYAANEKNNGKEPPSDGENTPSGRTEPDPSESVQPIPSVRPSVPEEPVRTGDVEEETTQKTWKDLQEDYLREDGAVGADFIDVDGDNEKEMIVLGERGAGNEKLITYHNGNVSILPLNGAAIAYVPGENAVMTAEYEDNTYIISIYSIENGKWVKGSWGSYQDPEEGPAVDEDGYDIYVNYKWNGEAVSEIDFYISLIEEIDVEKLVEIT